MTKEMKFRQECFDQVQRLSGLPQFPFNSIGQTELMNIAVERGQDDITHVKAVVNSFIDSIRCPTPGEFKAMFFQLFPPAPRDPCWKCRETPGWLITWHTDRDGNQVSAATRCSCGAIARFREPTAEEKENMRPFNPAEKAEYEAANEDWFGKALKAQRSRNAEMKRIAKPILQHQYPDAETIAERDAISREGA